MENDNRPTTSTSIHSTCPSLSLKSDSSTQTCLRFNKQTDRPPEIRAEDVGSSLVSMRSNNMYLCQIREDVELEGRPIVESCGRCFKVDEDLKKNMKPSLSSLPRYDYDDSRSGLNESTSSLPSYHTFNDAQSIKLFRIQSSSTVLDPKAEVTCIATHLVDEVTQIEGPEVVREILERGSDSRCSNKDCEREVQVINPHTENFLPIRCTRCRPSTSRSPERAYTSSPTLGNNYYVYTIQEGSTLHYTPRLTQSLTRTLPSYSAVLRLGPVPKPKPKFNPRPFGNFRPKQPPPSYAEAEGLFEAQNSVVSAESVFFGTEPVYMVCPHCRVLVMTEIHLERSTASHITAALLCLCCCWPCCLLPYCMRACYNIVHICPLCQYYFGTYRPF